MSQSPTAVQARARQKGVETSPKLGANLYLWVQWRLAQERTVPSGWWGNGCAPQPGWPAKLPDPSPEGHLGMRVHPGSMENTSSTGSRQDDAKRGAPCWGLLAPGHHGSATPPMETDGSLANAPTHRDANAGDSPPATGHEVILAGAFPTPARVWHQLFFPCLKRNKQK